VGNDDNTTAESVDGIRQTVNSGDIETVGRLVEQQHVGALNGQQRKDDTRLLPVGQRSHLGGLAFTSQTITAELLAPVLVILADVGELVADKVERRLCKVELLSGVLAVHTELQVGVAGHNTAGRAETACENVEQSRLADTVGSDKGCSRVHVDTEVEVLVEGVLLVARVRKGDVVERQHWRGQLLDLGEAEGKDTVGHDLLDETVGLHLVENLLAGLGLPDQVGIGTGRRNELLDVLDLVLLLLVRLGLVDLLLIAGLVVCVVVTSVVEELLHAHVDHVGAHAVQEIHGMRDEDQGAGPLLHVLLEPHAGLEIQMGSGVVEQQQRGLNEEGLAKRDTHTPSTGHVLCLLVDGDLVEAETGENERGAGVEGGRVHVLLTLCCSQSAARGVARRGIQTS
jgi:hypothetical protein